MLQRKIVKFSSFIVNLRKSWFKQGFSMIELLVIIVIISILSTVIVVAINPLELNRQTRDSTRLRDLENIQKAISLAIQDASVPIAEVLCQSPSYPPCIGRSIDNSSRAINGSGWVKVNLLGVKTVSLPVLETDPLNDSNYFYTYCSDGGTWEINAKLESNKYSALASNLKDGGDQNTIYEVGTNLNLIKDTGGTCTFTAPTPTLFPTFPPIPTTTPSPTLFPTLTPTPTPTPLSLNNSLVSYWKMDETSGSIVNDSIGGNNGPTAASITNPAKINKGRNFNSSGFVGIPDNDSLSFSTTTGMSVGFWINASTTLDNARFLDKQYTTPGNSEWLIACDTLGKLQFCMDQAGSNTNFIQVVSSANVCADLADGSWHYIVGTWSGGTSPTNLKLYKDNVLLSTDSSTIGTFTGMPNGDSMLNIGFPNTLGSGGMMDEVGIWRRPLSASEINTLWNSGNGLQYGFFP